MLVWSRGVCVLSFCSFCEPLSLPSLDITEKLCNRGAAKQQTLHLEVLIMSSKLSVLLLFLAVATATVLAQRRRPTTASTDEWNYKDGSEKVSMRGVANLTQVLDNWRFDILNQIKGLLQNDHQSLLPDYARIQPLSEALDDLYKEFNALKSHLGDLTEKFTAIESFIDEMKAGRASSANTNPAAGAAPDHAPAPAPAPAPASPPRQGTRRVVRKKNPPSPSQ